MKTSPALLDSLKCKIEKIEVNDSKAFAGFDGFVDYIQKPIKKKGLDSNEYFNTLQEFADHVKSLHGKSGQVELVTERIKLGGNAPILANTMGRLGINTLCFGAMGSPEVETVFSQLYKNVSAISLISPGKSHALEFQDGKLILSELGIFNAYNWKYIKVHSNAQTLSKAVAQCKLIALVDWVNLQHASDIWEGFLKDMIKPSGRKDYLFFFDLCDPSKKNPQQIDEVIDIISDFTVYGKVTLGLNENEANKIWLAFHGCDHFGKPDVNLPSLDVLGRSIYQTMNIDTLLIHPIDRTLVFQSNETLEMQGRLVTKPKVLTGGGDNLNAGYCLGLLNSFSTKDCMLLGMAASGSYIENGFGPEKKDIVNYLDKWSTELSESILESIKSTG